MERTNKPVEYRCIQGRWKQCNPPRTLKAEHEKKRSGTLAKKKQVAVAKKGKHSKQKDNGRAERKNEFYRVIK